MLILSLIALFIGPFTYNYLEKSSLALKFIDGFAFIALAGLILFNQVIFAENISLSILLLMFVGFLGPNLIEKYLVNYSQTIHKIVLYLAIFGLVIHSFADGGGLVHEEHGFLPLAVILHKIPDGICLWWLVRPQLGKKASWFLITILAIATAGGYFYSDSLIHSDSGLSSYLQAFVAGSILHVVFFRLHFHVQHDPENNCCETKNHWIESVGNFLAIIFLIFICFHEDNLDFSFFHKFIMIFSESAPALIFAHIISALLFAYLPHGSIKWLKKGNRLTQAIKGMLIGLPLPICSCGVLPLYRTLLARGAPMTAALAFLIATPSVGVDSIFIAIPFLGLKLSVIRLVSAAILSILVGVLVAEKNRSLFVLGSEIPKKDLFQSIKYSLFDLAKETAPWIILGIGLATVIDQHNDLLKIDVNPLIQNFVIGGISMFMYVCALESLPLASALLKANISAGSVLVFLLLGPATNLSSFLTLKNLHNKKIAFKFMLVCLLGSLFLAVLVDNLFTFEQVFNPTTHLMNHNYICAVILGTWYFFIFLKYGARVFFNLNEHKH